MRELPALGVIIVSFNSGDEILGCLESLLASVGVRLDIVVVDNASTDDTVAGLKEWAEGSHSIPADDWPFAAKIFQKPLPILAPTDDKCSSDGHRLTLIEAEMNSGYAGGVNQGLRHLQPVDEIDRFWVLNPDTIVPPQTARAFATAPETEHGFSLMGGRVIYASEHDLRIQSDGGRIDPRTGITHSLHQFADPKTTSPPDPETLDFITGASMVASRAFLEQAGPMAEDYFLYYEEVDWALRRGDLPLAYCSEAIVYHRAGTSIGSGRPGRSATPFSLYFMHRNRLRFVRQHSSTSLPGAYVYSLAKAAQLILKGQLAGARALLSGTFELGPPTQVRTRLSTGAAQKAFRRESETGS